MNRVLVVVALSLVFGGCVPGAAVSINSENIYHGYPCFEHCAEFQQGYQAAEIAALRESSQCQGSEGYVNGCKSYVNEYRIEQIENGGLYLKN